MTLITDGFISIFTPSKALRGYRMGRMGRAIASSLVQQGGLGLRGHVGLVATPPCTAGRK